jgi:ATP-dependent RNA helicase DHX36
MAEYRLEDAIEATGYVCEADSEFAIGAEQGGRGGGGRGGGGRTFNPLSGGGARSAKARAMMYESMKRTADLGDITEVGLYKLHPVVITGGAYQPDP